MARFKRGSVVEVLSRNDESFGVWRCAAVLSGNGDTFSVMFDRSSKTNSDDFVATVSREVIRPCPPIDVSINWSPGDLVEVFDDFSWKTAAILKKFSPNYYLVKLIGYSRQVRLHRSEIRARQLWLDGEWIVIGKGSQSMKESKTNKLQDSSSYVRMSAENNTGFLDSCVITDRTRKRASPYWSSNRKASKIQATEKKVDAVTFGEIDTRTWKNQTISSYEWDKGKPNYFLESFNTRTFEHNEPSIDECSVGSCSVISNRHSPTSPAIVGNSFDEDSDAESSYIRGNKENRKCYYVGVNVAVRIHSLELQAYRRTLEAFYASGPLNWEREVLLTNLRFSLNISNDEHLLELRNLVAPHVR